MNATLIRIGNSQGIRLPKPVIEQGGFEREVEMEVHHRKLVIRPFHHPRDGWNNAFSCMYECGDDALLDHITGSVSAWDEEEWEW